MDLGPYISVPTEDKCMCQHPDYLRVTHLRSMRTMFLCARCSHWIERSRYPAMSDTPPEPNVTTFDRVDTRFRPNWPRLSSRQRFALIVGTAIIIDVVMFLLQL